MKRGGEQGAALLAVLALVSVAGTIATIAQLRSVGLARDAARQRGRIVALHAAEGGLAKARHALRTDPAFVGEELTLGASRVAVTVERLGDDAWRVSAAAVTWPTGREGQPVRVVLVEETGAVRRYRGPPR